MIQLIAFIIFLVSVGAVSLIVYRKIPALVNLPQNGHHGIKKPQVITRLEKKIKDNHFHFFQKQILLQTLLSKTMVLIMKAERKVDVLLHGIRQKAQELDKEVKRKKI